jgi:hypothetical protein
MPFTAIDALWDVPHVRGHSPPTASLAPQPLSTTPVPLPALLPLVQMTTLFSKHTILWDSMQSRTGHQQQSPLVLKPLSSD